MVTGFAKYLITQVVLVMICTLLSACGKKGPVESLEPSDYPRTYPKPLEAPFPPLKKQDQKENDNGL